MVIVTHGLLDNAGSFDTLIPLLPKSFCYVCIDLPGHGFSSHFDHSQPFYLTSFVPAIKRITDHFERPNYILMGHSFGAVLGFTFAQLYPGYVSKVILLDNIGILHPNNPEVYSKKIHGFNEVLTNGSQNSKRSYSYEEVLQKIQASRFLGKLSWESADNITKRMVKGQKDRYVFTFDERLKLVGGMIGFKLDWEREMARERPVRCPVLLILSTPYNEYVTRLVEMVAYVEKQSNFVVYHIEDDHFLHTNHPQKINRLISGFLLGKNSKL